MIKDLVFMFLGYQAATTADPEFFTGIHQTPVRDNTQWQRARAQGHLV
jgi:hypothetical protein